MIAVNPHLWFGGNLGVDVVMLDGLQDISFQNSGTYVCFDQINRGTRTALGKALLYFSSQLITADAMLAGD